jgi:nucleoside-diphosphate-sugar epimerase
MRILFIGGTGVISSACTRVLLDAGHHLTLLTRGASVRPAPPGVEMLHADARRPDQVMLSLQHRTFDAVVNWIAFVPEHVDQDVRIFRGRVGQYVFISSASVYARPARLPITDDAPRANPIWAYSRAKIACEDLLLRAFHDEGFPATIVRPSHTYDPTYIPVHGGYTVVDRMRRGSRVIVHGDGTSPWTLTHHDDFAQRFAPLLGNPSTLGEAYHITSDEVLTWDQIFRTLAEASGAEYQPVFVPSALIAAYDPGWGDSLLGDKSHPSIFDNTKILGLSPDRSPSIPFSRGAAEMIAWHDADPARQHVDAEMDAIMERILDGMDRAKP